MLAGQHAGCPQQLQGMPPQGDVLMQQAEGHAHLCTLRCYWVISRTKGAVTGSHDLYMLTVHSREKQEQL